MAKNGSLVLAQPNFGRLFPLFTEREIFCATNKRRAKIVENQSSLFRIFGKLGSLPFAQDDENINLNFDLGHLIAGKLSWA